MSTKEPALSVTEGNAHVIVNVRLYDDTHFFKVCVSKEDTADEMADKIRLLMATTHRKLEECLGKK